MQGTGTMDTAAISYREDTRSFGHFEILRGGICRRYHRKYHWKYIFTCFYNKTYYAKNERKPFQLEHCSRYFRFSGCQPSQSSGATPPYDFIIDIKYILGPSPLSCLNFSGSSSPGRKFNASTSSSR